LVLFGWGGWDSGSGRRRARVVRVPAPGLATLFGDNNDFAFSIGFVTIAAIAVGLYQWRWLSSTYLLVHQPLALHSLPFQAHCLGPFTFNLFALEF
jgi:hypothetical protein